jgi:cell division protein ZapA
LEKPVRVKILDHDYLIRGDEDEERIQEIAEFVNDKFKEIRDNTEKLSEKKTAILAAFHIASEYFQLQKERDNMILDIQRRAQSLNFQIDTIIR